MRRQAAFLFGLAILQVELTPADRGRQSSPVLGLDIFLLNLAPFRGAFSFLMRLAEAAAVLVFPQPGLQPPAGNRRQSRSVDGAAGVRGAAIGR